MDAEEAMYSSREFPREGRKRNVRDCRSRRKKEFWRRSKLQKWGYWGKHFNMGEAFKRDRGFQKNGEENKKETLEIFNQQVIGNLMWMVSRVARPHEAAWLLGKLLPKLWSQTVKGRQTVVS